MNTLYRKLQLKYHKSKQVKRYVVTELSYILKHRKKHRDERLIISLTSYKERFGYIYWVILSLLVQKAENDLLVLYVYEKDYPFLPKKVKKLKGLIIKTTDEDLKPHKKYFYCSSDYPDNLIVTFDDDYLYSPYVIDSLYEQHLKYRDAVVAAKTNQIKFNGSDFQPYSNWLKEYTETSYPRKDLVAIGSGGILYPKGVLQKADNKKTIIEYALNQDDIWLKFIEIINGILTVNLQNTIFKKSLNIKYKDSLQTDNIRNGLNDRCIRDLCDYFKMNADDFKEDY